MDKARFAVTAALLGSIALAGCAAKRPAPPPPAPEPAFYGGLREAPGAFDASVLAGRRIVIDPGHGGSFDGALGVDSLREADANLGVALYLWGLCTDAGADARLTRTADRDRLPDGSKEAADDLRARAAMANALEPDVFVSIHHNSNLELDRGRNAIEVYYRSGDTGPSLELAQAIELHLARNLGIPVSAVKPGNYYVLRNSEAGAAILGEASFLSHPLVEDRLRLAEKQRLEAQAYFFGLVDYFSRGVPSVERLSPASDTVAAPVEIVFAVDSAAGVPLDPSSARVRIGETTVAPLYDASRSVVRVPMDPDLPNGAFTVQASIRSARGATGRSAPFTMLLSRPPRHLVPLPVRPAPGGDAILSVRVLDADGRPVADGRRVEFSSKSNPSPIAAASGGGVASIRRPLREAVETFTIKAGDVAERTAFPDRGIGAHFTLQFVDARSKSGIPDVRAAGVPAGSFSGDENGIVAVPLEPPVETLLVAARGYRGAALDGGDVIRAAMEAQGVVPLEPVLGGVLIGKRIVLDPGGGGADPGGRGPNALRGAAVTLAVARRLADALESAGATAVLTRKGEEQLSEIERVYLVNRADPDLAIGIRVGALPDSAASPRLVLQYPGSAKGAAAADTLAAALSGLAPGGAFARGERASLFLQQTACTALEIYCGPIEDAAVENAAGEAWARDAARRILEGLARHFAGAAQRRPGP